MSSATMHQTSAHGHGHDAGAPYPGPPSPSVLVGYGFWLFLLSDVVLFSSIFAAYGVLYKNTAGGPSGKELFHLSTVGWETAALLLSSFTCGMFGIAARLRNKNVAFAMAALTFLLGAMFLFLEIQEFSDMIHEGAGPQRSAFLSAFFTLVGCHGAHVTLGLVWLLVMMCQIGTIGFPPKVQRRIYCFSLFWHALDIIWIGVFTIVYLAGVA